jgi:alpha-L-rhamnosidase
MLWTARLVYLFAGTSMMFKKLSTSAAYFTCLFAITTYQAMGASSIQPDDLRCESMIDPQGIDIVKPRLTWAMAPTVASDRALMQSAYQIEVASSPEQLARGHGDLWDSGKVSSSESVNIRYTGTALHSLEGCYWQVKVWDQADQESAWSKPARWSMGLLSQNDWKGIFAIGCRFPWVGKSNRRRWYSRPTMKRPSV